MATWTEPVIATANNLSLGIGRSSLSMMGTSPSAWVGESTVREVSLEQDEPILVSLQLKVKWGL